MRKLISHAVLFMMLLSFTPLHTKQFNTGVLRLADGTFMQLVANDNGITVLDGKNEEDMKTISCPENARCSVSGDVNVKTQPWSEKEIYDTGPLQLVDQKWHRILITKNELYLISAPEKTNVNQSQDKYIKAGGGKLADNATLLGPNGKIIRWER